MSLDQELRSVLQEAAGRCSTAMPDVDAVRAGGRRLRHRQRVGHAVAAGVAVAVVTIGSGVVAWNGRAPDLEVGPAPSQQSSSPWWSPVTPTADTGSTKHTTMPFFLDLDTGKKTLVPSGLAPDSIGIDGLGTYASYDVSPDGRRVAISTCHGDGCASSDRLFVVNLDGSDLREINLAGRNGRHPEWSPDGTQLVYQLSTEVSPVGGDLVVQDVRTGRRTLIAHLTRVSGWWFAYASFSPDGNHVIYHKVRDDGTSWDTWVVRVHGGDPVLLLEDAHFPVYVGNSGDIAFVEGMDRGGPSIRIADPQGDRHTVVEAHHAIAWLTASPDGTRIACNDGGSIRVVDVSTGASTVVAAGDSAEWVDDDTLLVAPKP